MISVSAGISCAPPTGGGGTTGTVTGTQTDTGAAAVAGGTVQLIQGGSVVTTATPNGSGVYTFSNVTQGSYTVTNQPPAGYSINDAGTFNISVSGGATTTQNLSVQTALGYTGFQGISTAQLLAGNNWSGGGKDLGNFSYTGPYKDPGGIVIDATGGPTGEPAMRYNWIDGSAGACSGAETTINIGYRLTTPPVSPDAWIRWTSKESAAFENGIHGCSRSYKFLLFQFENATLNGRFGAYLFSGGGSDCEMHSDLSDNQSHLWQSPTNYNINGNPTYGGSYNTWAMSLTGIGTSTCVGQMYMNGSLLFTTGTVQILPGHTFGGAGWNFNFGVGANINNGPPQVQSRWFREFGLYATRPSLLAFPA